MEHSHAHLQTMAAIWRQLPVEPQTLTAEGVLAPYSEPFRSFFSEDLHLFAGLSGTEDFFKLLEQNIMLWGPFSMMKTSETPSSAQISNSREQHNSPIKHCATH